MNLQSYTVDIEQELYETQQALGRVRQAITEQREVRDRLLLKENALFTLLEYLKLEKASYANQDSGILGVQGGRQNHAREVGTP